MSSEWGRQRAVPWAPAQSPGVALLGSRGWAPAAVSIPRHETQGKCFPFLGGVGKVDNEKADYVAVAHIAISAAFSCSGANARLTIYQRR